MNEVDFDPAGLDRDVRKRLGTDRYAWLTTVAQSGMPVPMLVWFYFDGARFTVYSEPRAGRVAHVFAHPEVSLQLESDGVGGGVVIVGGRAQVTAEHVDPRQDPRFWAKYHLEAEATGLGDTLSAHSTRLSITPTTLWTDLPV